MGRWEDVGMDPVLLLLALVLLLLGAGLAVLALLFRAGRGRAFRSWAGPEGVGPGRGFRYVEGLVLVVLPLCAQALLVSAPLALLAAIDALRELTTAVLLPVVVILEVILWVVLLLATSYRSILPLWIYPGWLRPQRRREREIIRGR